MHCFAWVAVEALLIKIVIICAVLAIVRALLKVVPTGEFAWIVSVAVEVVKIILIAIIVIALIGLAFEMLACL